MQAAPARYYDGLTADAIGVSAKWGVGELLIYRPADFSIVARWRLEELVVLGDTEHEAIPAVGKRGSEARLVVVSPELRAELGRIAYLGALAVPPPRPARRIVRLGAAIAAVLVAFWAAVEVGGNHVEALVPYGLQARLGREVQAQLLAGRSLCHGTEGLTAINDLANRLARAGGLAHPVSVEVVRGGPVNALTLPGGRLLFFSDLIDRAADGEEVAGVLAHEIGHAVHHHPIRGMARQYGVNLVLRLLTGGYSDIGALGSGGGLLLALRNGRAFEREADATGIALLEGRGLRADGMSRFFEQMMKEEPAGTMRLADIWSDHPPTAERIAATRRSSAGRPAFTDREWKAIRSVCD